MLEYNVSTFLFAKKKEKKREQDFKMNGQLNLQVWSFFWNKSQGAVEVSAHGPSEASVQ